MAAEPQARLRRLGDPLKGALNRSRLENSPGVEGAAPGLRGPQHQRRGSGFGGRNKYTNKGHGEEMAGLRLGSFY